MLYQYHPPFMYGFLRLNEVLYRIKGEGQQQQEGVENKAAQAKSS
jgi:hypothetical protein